MNLIDRGMPDGDPARCGETPPITLADELLVSGMEEAGTHQAAKHPGWLMAGFVLVAINLRPALSSLGPVLGDVQQDLALSGALAGLLTTLPVLCLGVFGFLAPRLAQRCGSETAIFAALLVLASGIALRGIPTVGTVILGTVAAGAGIGIVGVLFPSIVKREFAARAGLMTGVFTMLLCLGGAAGAGLTVPLGQATGGWQGALMSWALPVLLAALAWWPQVPGSLPGTQPAPSSGVPPALGSRAPLSPVTGLWRDPLAWQVAGYMGCQSSLAFIAFNWLPAILQDRGFDARAAGFVSSVSILIQAISALVVPTLAPRLPDQRSLVLIVIGCCAAGFLGIVFTPSALVVPWSAVLGLGLGGAFGLGLTLIVLRARNAHVAAHLSGMAQSIGYSIAALGPFGVGLLHEASGAWMLPAAFFGLMALVATGCGLGAARNRYVLAGASG